MTDTDTLLAKLRDRGLDVTAEQAEAMAIRLAGSVQAYLAELERNDDDAASYRPLPPGEDSGAPEGKFSEPVAYTVESPGESGLPT